jgi:hypothetical protein
MTRVPKILGSPRAEITAPLGDHPKPSRLPVWLRVVLEFCSDAVSAIF